jgi:hypothetical protein
MCPDAFSKAKVMESRRVVTPLKNGGQPFLKHLKRLDSGLHRNDQTGDFRLFTRRSELPHGFEKRSRTIGEGNKQKVRVEISTGLLSKVIMVRVLPGSDIVEGIHRVSEKLDIETGAIAACIGSLQSAAFLVAVPLKNKIGAGYSEPRHIKGPLELLSAQGTIGQETGGDRFIHLHAVLSDARGNVFGGHLVRGGNPVLITCEVTIGQLENVRMVRRYDPEVDMKVLMPSSVPICK